MVIDGAVSQVGSGVFGQFVYIATQRTVPSCLNIRYERMSNKQSRTYQTPFLGTQRISKAHWNHLDKFHLCNVRTKYVV